MNFNEIVNKVKSKGVEAIAGSDFIINKYINPRIKEYGEIIELSIKSEKKEIYAKVLLHEEKEPINVNILDYALVDHVETPCIIINKCTTNRQWMTTLAEKFLCGKEISIPKDKFVYIKNVL